MFEAILFPDEETYEVIQGRSQDVSVFRLNPGTMPSTT
ncbi:head-to-tail joining protein [Salmonella phage 18-India]|nr:head-to-tail joining protein [Salmonella phage 18-India]